MLVFGGNVIPNEPLKKSVATDGVGDVRTYMVLFSMYVEEDAEVSCIPVVSEFPEVFPDDICELPPEVLATLFVKEFIDRILFFYFHVTT